VITGSRKMANMDPNFTTPSSPSQLTVGIKKKIYTEYIHRCNEKFFFLKKGFIDKEFKYNFFNFLIININCLLNTVIQ